MILSTVDLHGCPDGRVVLLKGIMVEQFLFYTHYDSAKAQQMAACPHVALTFYWPVLARQVRIRGKVAKISEEISSEYFFSRPLGAQLGAIFSPQSKVISSREALEKPIEEWIATHPEQIPEKPTYWGGYGVIAESIEFWQGRDNRLHDRIAYYREANTWKYHRLAP